MKTEKKQSWMIYAIVILAVMNISTLATIIYHQNKSVKSTEDQPANQSQSQTDNEADRYTGRYFRDKLNLSGMQMNRFRDFNMAFRRETRDISRELVLKRKQMLDEMAAANSDTAMLNTLSESIGMLHIQLKKITFRYYLNIKGICDAEQSRKLEQLFSEMFINDIPVIIPGRGGMGWQHGRRTN